ncbi:hypothetical protein WM04_09350 [Burkholderia ubonensis]|uniref:hypothetical protein n=1 Tax=Burkholderia ubonensis TaxID=101571 RepID=UPI000752A6E7|nr:hypothetical protein [Burkholderia ubonensis]KWI34113.1 hypothetical protein WM04_09350 [Burkholderia ubonensis]KWK69160.1 hypothetical protein WM15_00280 [Burkholderia ubonensis]OJB12601.1 hypothetical protein BGV53_25870 [Burkholderia ubonensis]
MYEQLEAVAVKLNDLQSYLDHTGGSDRDTLLCDALEAAAHECLAAKAESDLDRQRLASLHHGFMAANRIVQRLQETSTIARD